MSSDSVVRWMFVAALAAGACDDDGITSDPVGSFDDEVPRFIDAVCGVSDRCDNERPDGDCEDDVEEDMADAKAALDEAGEEACAMCMHVTIEVIEGLGSRCDPTDAELERLFDACGENDEACAGFP
jgi:hypothetical protein